jgi:hypothetical protein
MRDNDLRGDDRPAAGAAQRCCWTIQPRGGSSERRMLTPLGKAVQFAERLEAERSRGPSGLH